MHALIVYLVSISKGTAYIYNLNELENWASHTSEHVQHNHSVNFVFAYSWLFYWSKENNKYYWAFWFHLLELMILMCPLWFLYKRSCDAQIEMLLLFSFQFVHFIFFFCLISKTRTSSTMLNKGVKYRQLHLVPDLRVRAFCLLELNKMLAVSFS